MINGAPPQLGLSGDLLKTIGSKDKLHKPNGLVGMADWPACIGDHLINVRA